MRQQRVYDLPTRVFHFLFAVIFLAAFTIAKTSDDESVVFNYHSLLGITLSFVVLLRIIWGVVGTRHARFSNFRLHPKELVSYFKGILSGSKQRWAGHNPASSWAALTMMFLALGLGFSGYMMTSGNGQELLEEIHEIFANTFVIFVGLHIAGLVLHTLRHRDMIALSMIDGKKADVDQGESIQKSYSGTGILFLALVVGFAWNLYRNYNPQSRSLNLWGTMLQLGENETDHDKESLDKPLDDTHEENND